METIPAKNIVFRTKSPSQWFGTDYNMNLYRGCPHGCIYCDSRSDCYHNPDFDRVKIKENGLALLQADLRRKVKKGVIGTGAMSDPYNHFEASLGLTRGALELINTFRFGVAIATKSPLVAMDQGILQKIRTHSPVLVKMTITTFDDELCRRLEPHVAPSSERFMAIKTLSEAGIYCGVLLMPILPFINDSEENIQGILRQAKAVGAKFVYPAFGMTLRTGNREYYYEKLDALFPGMSNRYRRAFGERYYCSSRKAKRLEQLFIKECEELGLLYQMKAIIQSYRQGYGSQQLSFF